MATSLQLIEAEERLRSAVNCCRFSPPIALIYNPLDYAWAVHEAYLRKAGGGRKKIIFLGMNPGPFGMTQTGVPFGEVAAVRDWLELERPVGKPAQEHPKRPVTGFACTRSEVSGRRLWGLFASRFGRARDFFEQHFVLNYCPLVFMEAGGRNLTPDKLPVCEQATLFAVCDEHLREVVRILAAEWVIGVGDFAYKRAVHALQGEPVRLGRILHPSPASPAANRDWSGQATAQMRALGLWD